MQVSVEVKNTGVRPGDEVVQLYLKDAAASFPVPRLQMAGFKRINLAPGQQQTVTFTINPDQMALINDQGQWMIEPGEFRLWIGGRQPDLRRPDRNAGLLESKFNVLP